MMKPKNWQNYIVIGMKIKKLFKDIPGIEIKGSKETEVMGLCADSRRVAPFDLFIARRGSSFDASHFIQDAIKAGALAILTDFYNPFLTGITQIIAKEITRDLEGLLSYRFYEDPSSKLNLIGITGTSGKTSMSYMIWHLLSSREQVGLIGTIETITGRGHTSSELTTPDCVMLHRTLKEMVSTGCTSTVMEVSSHALDQGRLAYTYFDTAVFTNLSNDHLDYHKDMESYFQAKSKIFDHMKKGGRAVICAECPYAMRYKNGITYGFSENAMVRAKDIELSMDGSSFTLIMPNKQEEQIFLPLLGRHNILNALGACAASNLPLHVIKKQLGTMPPIKGRMQRIEGTNIIIDYSHKPDALKHALLTLREVTKGKIILVFGAGGDRDKGKRPMMGKIATSLADEVIITSDNPRSEDPMQIIEDIVAGATKKVKIEADRRAAIKMAIEISTQEDVILIAGKGHEARQIFRHTTLDFDDYKVAEELCIDFVSL